MEPDLIALANFCFCFFLQLFSGDQKFCFSGYIIQDDSLNYCFYKDAKL